MSRHFQQRRSDRSARTIITKAILSTIDAILTGTATIWPLSKRITTTNLFCVAEINIGMGMGGPKCAGIVDQEVDKCYSPDPKPL